MPDRHGFNHLPDHGLIHHRCIVEGCGWPEENRNVHEKERARHAAVHARERQRESNRKQAEGLRKARSMKRLIDSENKLLEGRPTVATESNTAEKGMLAEKLRGAVVAIPATLVEKKAYFRIGWSGNEKKTLGYLYLGTRVPSVEVPLGSGSYERVSVHEEADVSKVVERLEKIAAELASKNGQEPEAQPKSAKPDPKPSQRRKKANA